MHPNLSLIIIGTYQTAISHMLPHYSFLSIISFNFKVHLLYSFILGQGFVQSSTNVSTFPGLLNKNF